MPEKNVDAVPVAELLREFDAARRHRRQFDTNWDRNDRYYAGNHWYGIKKRKWWESQPVIDKSFEYVEIVRALLADQRWGLDALPRTVGKDGDESDGMTISDKASKVNHLLDYIWDDARIQYNLAEALIHTFTKGTGILKAYFDPDIVSKKESGRTVIEAVNPKRIFPDQDATCIEDAAYLFDRREVTYAYVLRRWPDKVTPEMLAQGGAAEADWTPNVGPDAMPRVFENKTLDLLECWYHSEAVEEIHDSERFDETIGKWVYDVRKKYPHGRYTLMLGNGIVIEDKPSPYSYFPYVLLPEIPVEGQFWGGCTLDRLVPIQNSINLTAQSIIDNGNFLSTGVWVIDDKSGIDPKSLPKTGAPGGVVVKKQGTEARRDGGTQLPPHQFETLKMLIDLFDRVGGLPDVLRGVVPGRQPVQTTMMQQEAGELRTRERARRVEDALSRLGSIILDIVKRYWTDERTYRRVKADGSLDVFGLSADDLEGWDFDIIVRPGSTLPLDRMFATQKALEMRGQGIQIPDAYILKLSGLPGIEEVIADMASEQMPMPGDDAMPEGGEMPPAEAMMQGDEVPFEDFPGMEEQDPFAALAAQGQMTGEELPVY